MLLGLHWSLIANVGYVQTTDCFLKLCNRSRDFDVLFEVTTR